jgi:hypothetical protein
MTLRANHHALMRRALGIAYQRAVDAHTVEDAVRHHSELVDLLAIEAMAVRRSGQSEAAKEAALSEINAHATHHRDAVDRLTDIIEGKQQLVWRP